MRGIRNSVRTFSHVQILDYTYKADIVTPKHYDHVHRISIVLQGKLKELACGKEEYAKCGSLVIKPGDMIHQNQFGPEGTRIVSVAFKRNYFENIANVQFCDWQWYHGRTIAAPAFSFVQNLAHLASEEELDELLFDLIASLPLSSKGLPSSIPPWLKDIEEKIREEYHQPLQTKNLAHQVNVHPVYLARIFRKHYHCSVKDFIQSLRLQQAIEELSQGKKSLVDIALDAGFSDQSHLNRSVKKAFDMSPGIFRKWTAKPLG